MMCEEVIIARFSDGLFTYITDFFSAKTGVLYRPRIDYLIPNSECIAENAEEVLKEIRMQKKVREYSSELKKVAEQYLPQFLERYPQYKDADCLKIE